MSQMKKQKQISNKITFTTYMQDFTKVAAIINASKKLNNTSKKYRILVFNSLGNQVHRITVAQLIISFIMRRQKTV